MNDRPPLTLALVLAASALLWAGCADDAALVPTAAKMGEVIAGPVMLEAVVLHGANDPFSMIANAAGTTPSHPDDLIYRRIVGLIPVRAPDGHHVSLGEWTQALGRATMACSSFGFTRYTLTFEGLIPFGNYTVWNVLYDRSLSPQAPFGRRVAGGALGPASGAKNVFRASASGAGYLEVSVRPGPMGFGGTMPACVLTEAQGFKLIVTYHIDGQRHGAEPGPAETQVDHLVFYF